MKRFITEQFCKLIDTEANETVAKIVTEYGYTAGGNVMAVSAHYTDARNNNISLDGRVVELTGDYAVSANGETCLPITEIPVCYTGVDGVTQSLRMLTEYGWDAGNNLIVSKTIYTSQDGLTVVDTTGGELLFGACNTCAPDVPMYAPGALLAANICVGSPTYAPQGNLEDVRTVGASGTYATFTDAMADATVVAGTVLKAVSDVVDTAVVNVSRAVVIDLAGFTASNATAVTMFNITASDAVIKNGTLHHTKTTNTSIEAVVQINITSGVAYVMDNTIKVQEFGVVFQGGANIVGNKFEYVGASATNSHRFIAVYKITAESKIDNNEFKCSTIISTTRYSNFVFISAIAGSTWTAPFWVIRNKQTGGSLRQFVFNEALVPTAGSQLIVASNTFNDFNGGIGLVTPALYNGLDKIVVVDNVQGADATGNFKGVFFVDGSGTLSDSTVLVYGGNATSAGALRADYVSLANDTVNIIARKNTVVPSAIQITQRLLEDALKDTGTLLQDLKAKRTYIVDADGNEVQGYGTVDSPYVIPVVHMFEVQVTDSFDSTYYYYGGLVGSDWQVHRYLQDNPADPLYLVPQIAEASSNSGVVDLTSAWTSRTTLNYA